MNRLNCLSKVLIILLLAYFLAQGTAWAGPFASLKLTRGERGWEVKWNQVVDSLEVLWDQTAALGTQVANWVTTLDSLTLIQASPANSDAHTFTPAGDYSTLLTAGKRLVADCGADGLLPNTVDRATYTAPNTTVAVNSHNLSSNLAAVSHYATRNGVKTYGSGDIVASEYGAPSWANLQAAAAVANAAGRRLLLTPGVWPVAGDLRIPAPVYAVPTAKFQIATTKTLTLPQFDGSLDQHFDCVGTGTVTGLKQATPDWFIDTSSADDTPGVQKCFDVCGNVYLSRNYNVSHVSVGGCDKHINFNGFWLTANSGTAGIDSLLELTAQSSCLYNVRLNGAFKTNYKSLMHWHSDGFASCFNKIFGLTIHYGIRGLVYGAHPGVAPDSSAQSENTVYSYTTWGVQNPFYGNQTNGFIYLDSPILHCQDNEWVSGFSYTDGQALENVEGEVLVRSGELIKSASKLGYAATLGAQVDFIGVTIETACPFLVKNGVTANLRDGNQGLMDVSSCNYFEMEDGATGALNLINMPFTRPAGLVSFDTSKVVSAPKAPDFLVRLTNCYLLNWRWVSPTVPVYGCKSEWVNTVYEVTDTGLKTRAVVDNMTKPNLLSLLNVDTLGVSVQASNMGSGDRSGGWTCIGYGGGMYAKGQVADLPTGYLKTLELYAPAGGAAGLYSPAPASITAATIAFVDSNPDTITDSGSGFLTAGFQDGQRIIISGSASNNVSRTIQTVTAGTMTLFPGETLTGEGAGATVTIVGEGGIKVRPSAWYYLSAQIKKTADTANIWGYFYDLNGILIGSGTQLIASTAVTTSWGPQSALYQTPAHAAYMAIVPKASAGGICRVTDIRVCEAF